MIFIISFLVTAVSYFFYGYLFFKYGFKAIRFICVKTYNYSLKAFFCIRNLFIKRKISKEASDFEADLVKMYDLYNKAEGRSACEKNTQIASYKECLSLANKWDLTYQELGDLFTVKH
jgi:hypothetical protein